MTKKELAELEYMERVLKATEAQLNQSLQMYLTLWDKLRTVKYGINVNPISGDKDGNTR